MCVCVGKSETVVGKSLKFGANAQSQMLQNAFCVALDLCGFGKTIGPNSKGGLLSSPGDETEHRHKFDVSTISIRNKQLLGYWLSV